MRRMNSPAQPGFTFTELLACLALILVIAATLFPAFASARQAARRTNCRSNLAQLLQAAHIYSQDYDGVFPPDARTWRTVMEPYTKNNQIYVCPDDPRHPLPPPPLSPEADEPPMSTVGTSYVYQPGHSNDDASTIPLFWDNARRHRGGVNVAYLGGSIRLEPNHGEELRHVKP